MKYGLIWGIYNDITADSMNSMLSLYKLCDGLVIGLFSDEIVGRFCIEDKVLPFVKRKEFIEHLDFVVDVICIDRDNFSVETFCGLICKKYDVTMSGLIIGIPQHYGQVYEQEKEWCMKNSVCFYEFDVNKQLCTDCIETALGNDFIQYNIVLFGTGEYFNKYMNKFGDKYPPLYAVDNNSDVWGTDKKGVQIKNPLCLSSETSDNLLVIICAKNSSSIIEQLLSMRMYDYRIMTADTEQSLYKEWQIILDMENKHLSACHRLLLELLTEFDFVCEKYQLRYFLSCGSAIGAVRHHGFIPWDDDVDVAMYQEDFDILKAHASEIWPEGSDYRLVCPEDLGNGAFLDFLNRLMCVREHVDTNTFDKVKGKADDYVQRTANVDIYILNHASTNPKAQKRNTLILKAIYGLGMGHRAYIDFKTYKHTSMFTRFVIRITSAVGRIMSLKYIINLHEKYARRFDKIDSGLCYESNGYVTEQVFDSDIFGNGKRIEVCGKQFMVASDVDRYLEEHGYHDYMMYPPVNKRKPTHALKSPDLV